MNKRDEVRARVGQLLAAQNHVAERFLAEMEFVEGLAGLHPRQAAGWNRLVNQAWAVVDRALAGNDPAAFAQAVGEAEHTLTPIGKIAKTYTVHCAGHAHIDMNWMWSWPETVHTTNDTFLTMLKLMDEFPDFCFTQSQASVYEIVERYHPAMLRDIRRRVKEGRWEIVASYWVEAEKNLASGEALARQMLYTRKYMKELFDLDPEDIVIDWSPDTFGHPHTIPTIDARGGVRRYYMCRGGTGWSRPPVFWFQGPDGARILVNHETTWYNDSIGPHNTKALLNFCSKTGLRDYLHVYGVGDHGGGPTRRDIVRAHDMDRWPVFPRFQLSTTGPYYEILESHGDRWPTLDRELNFEFPGCYTTQTQIKRNNRLAEIYGGEAEQVAVLAMRALGTEYPAGRLEQVWRDICFSHFHDILPGSGVAATRQYNDGMFQRLAATTSMIRVNALRALAARIDTRCGIDAEVPPVPPERESVAMGAGPGRNTMLGGLTAASHAVDGPRPYVVFNPTAADRTEVVAATVWDPQTGVHGDDLSRKNYAVRLADGRTIPAQKLSQGEWYWGNRCIDIAFPVEVGSLGYAACVAIDDGTRFTPPYGSAGYEKIMAAAEVKGAVKICDTRMGVEGLPVGGYAMENDHLLVDFDARTGGICRLVDKATGKDLAVPGDPMGVLEYEVERHGGMTAWTIYDSYKRAGAEVPSLVRGQRGPWVASVIAKTRIANSEVTITYTLKAHQPWVEVGVVTRWVEIGNPGVGTPKLRIKFPLALEGAQARYEIPFGSIERSEHGGEEVPALRWADVTGKTAGGGRAGCALLNDSKYGHSLDGATLRLTLIRSSYDPDPIPEVGDHSIRMALVPHGRPVSVARLMELGAALNQPLQVLHTDMHAGDFPARASACRVSSANVILVAVKKAEQGDAVVFRFLETEGKATAVRVALDPVLMGRAVEAVETDLLERDTAASTARVAHGGFGFKAAPHAIVSVKVRFAG